jgi:hypothetical protein
LIIGECALDAISIVAEVIITIILLEIYIGVPVGGSSFEGRKMLVME